MTRFAHFLIAITGAILIGTMWFGVPRVQACHTALHCIQEEIDENVDPFLELAPRDIYGCLLEGRSSTWTYAGGFPRWGDYHFEGNASCLHLDRDGSAGQDDTGAHLEGSFELGGEHSQLLGLPACTMALDGFHVQPVEYGRITLEGDSESPLVFRHDAEVAVGQGDLVLHDDGEAADGIIDGYGSVSLVSTDAVETFPDTDPGCVTSEAPGFFFEAVVIAGVF